MKKLIKDCLTLIKIFLILEYKGLLELDQNQINLM